MLVKKVPSTTHLRFLFVGDEFYMGGGGRSIINLGVLLYIYTWSILFYFL